jgi:hypothetical protein
MKVILFLVAIFAVSGLSAQECNNIRAEYDNQKVYIYYDLSSSDEKADYFVAVNCSKSTFKESLKYVSGAVGRNIKAGKDLKIIWDCKKEYNELDLKEIEFKVAASSVAPANYYTATVTGKIKRGNKVNIAWLSGSSGEEIIIDLYKKDTYYKRIVSTLDLGSFQWEIPDFIEKGNEYQIKITNPEKNEMYSDRFEVK